MGILDEYFSPQTYSGLLNLPWAKPPQEAAQAFNAPSSSYNFGNVNVPVYGQPDSAALPTNATPTSSPSPMVPQVPQAAASAAGGGFKGGMEGFVQNLHNGPIGAIVGGIAGAMGTNTNATERALMARGLDADTARAARQNPQILNALLPSLFNHNSFKFTVLPDGTVVRENPRDGTVSPVYQSGTKPQFGVIGKDADGRERYGFIDAGKGSVKPIDPVSAPAEDFVTGPDGKKIPIPPGVDRKSFVNEISRENAKIASGHRNEVQAKSEKFGNKMELAESNLQKLQGQGLDQWGRAMESVPFGMGNYATNTNYQKYKQARDNFITALLRDESGAAIGTEEFNRYERELFPRPGDDAQTIAQKAETRRVAIEGMKKAAGPGYKSPELPKAAPDPLGIRK